MIDPSRARRIFAGAAASVFAVAAAAGMAAGVTAGVTAVTAAAGVTVAGSTAAGPGIRADSKITPRCFAAGPIEATSTSSAHGRHVSYVLAADRQPGQVRPRCFHR